VADYKVLLFEPVHQKGLDHLAQNGCEVVYAEGFEPAQILEAVQDVDGILARAQGYIDGPVMDAGPRLKVVGRHGIGVDNVDVPAATERGVFVVNTPMAPGESVAEFVAMSMMALPRRIVQADRATRELDWGFRNRVHAPELLGKTLGIVGFGRIGRRIAEICGLGFRMKIIYADAYPADAAEEARLSATRVEMDELLTQSDFITLNVPLLDSTHHLIDAAALASMKSSAILVNCARGPVVDENALADALNNDVIAGAVIDVFEEEPAVSTNPLLTLDNVLLTPHCSGNSAESAENMSMVATDIVKVLKGTRPEFPVNEPPTPRQTVS
jgi:D-3-phosphoglycerate dehydrogenase / 2-oxoglutarate reductase